ncbi:MAG: ABC transporter permease [Rikenellaceae bacterium]|nr:ABC transporter permease [Rikenellaceae bacterium]
MNTILRNFLVTLKRFKAASSLNILGLSVAFAAFIVIMMQVNYDRGFDRFHPDAEHIYRVELSSDSSVFTPVLSRPMIDLFSQSSRVAQSSLLFDMGEDMSFCGPYLTVEQHGSKVGYKENTAMIFPEFVDMFDFRMVEGDRKALEQPDRVLIPESMAKRFFGEASAIDQRITFMNDTVAVSFLRPVMTVGGVYKDFPDNTQIKNRIYIPLDRSKMLPVDAWGSSGYSFFVKLHSPDSKAELEKEWLAQLKPVLQAETWMTLKDVRLTALPDVYYETDTMSDRAQKGSRTTTAVLSAIALLIIIIASINFVNFATSLTPMRIKSINTQKVLGSPVSMLRKALIGEAVGISLLAYLLALLITYLLGQTSFDQFLSTRMDLGSNLPILGLALVVALAVGLVAGVYPAFYSTSFPPALVLKGSFGMSPKGRKLRTTLIGFQYVVSIGLIIAALFMQVQNDFMRSVGTGLDTQSFALVRLSPEMANRSEELLRNRLTENAQVQGVSFGASVVGSSDNYSNWGFGKNEEGENMRMEVLYVDWDLPRMLGVKITEGRDYLESEQDAQVRKLLVNETARRMYGLKIGQQFQNGTEIVGFVEDFNFKSLRNTVGPMTFMVGEVGVPLEWLYVKTSGDPYDAAGVIKNTLASVDPTYPADIQFYDTVFNKLYMKERRTTGLVTIFSLLAVVISLVGVFGLVLFETQYRRKEIGVRKVMGATVLEILKMFNRKFIWIVAVCFVIAAPFAWYGVREWLASFAYRTPMYWWIFALSLLVVMLITVTTVSVQSLRAAMANPVDSLKSE